MANNNPEKHSQDEKPGPLPIQLKFMLGVIALGLVLLLSKLVGVI